MRQLGIFQKPKCRTDQTIPVQIKSSGEELNIRNHYYHSSCQLYLVGIKQTKSNPTL